MFGAFGGPGSISGGILAAKFDPEEDRPPPPAPTAVTFPEYPPPPEHAPSNSAKKHPSDLKGLFARVRGPFSITHEHLAAFNISLEPQYAFEELVPPGDDVPFIPPPSWLQDATASPSDRGVAPETGPDASGVASRKLSNGRPAPELRDFSIRIRELYYKNHEAYTALSRAPPKSKKPPRLTNLRRFWEGLDNLAYYWDSSLDRYANADEKGHGTDQLMSDGKTKTLTLHSRTNSASTAANATISTGTKPDENNPPPPKSTPTIPIIEDQSIQPPRRLSTANIHASSPPPSAPSPKKAKRTADFPLPPSSSPSSRFPATTAILKTSSPSTLPTKPESYPPSPSSPKFPNINADDALASNPNHPSPARTYRGLRIDTGSNCPLSTTTGCITAFVEAAIWPFGLTLTPPRLPGGRRPTVQLGPLSVPVQLSCGVYQPAMERQKARAGWVNGPVCGVSVRGWGHFGGVEGNEGTVDLVKEVGCLLRVAQERARGWLRKGEEDGKGKWWFEKPRWGGGPGGEVGEADAGEEKESDLPEVEKSTEERLPGMMRGRERGRERDRGKTKKQAMIDAWKTLRPSVGVWDMKVECVPIGKDPESEFDEVFLVSSLNHHVSILKLRVHASYLKRLADGVLPPLGDDGDPPYVRPTLQRTRWFDLFETEDRVEAFKGLWGIMAYMMRTPEPKTGEVTDVAMNDA